MPADEELRTALSTRFPDLHPDIEAELESLLVRADARARRRRMTYVAGLVAAAVVATLVVLTQDRLREARGPEPVDNPAVQATKLRPLGMYSEPKVLDPGRYKAYFVGPSGVSVELDIPVGWGQDDLYAFATGPGDAPFTRRIDLFDSVRTVRPDPCVEKSTPVGPGSLDLARALASLARTRSTRPMPVTLDGHPGYFVRLEDARQAGSITGCASGTVPREGGLGVIRAAGMAGWTSQIWVIDVGDTTVVISASQGPDVTTAQETELVRIVESASFVLR
jgi:hypothetical protein